jgi:hypothetical protein
MKILLTIFFALLGLLLILKAIYGVRRGSIHYYIGGITGYLSGQPDLFTRQEDGLWFWLICLTYFGLGVGLIAGVIWVIWLE